MIRTRTSVLLAIVALLVAPALSTAETVLKPGDRVAIIGDSITEQKLYSKYVECYLLACSGVPDLAVFQYGWSGERADGFANRCENDLAGFQPTVATTCYGMNDGSYQPYSDQIGKAYEDNMRRVLANLAKIGVRTTIVGSPGAVDQAFFRPGQMMGDQPAHVAYNDNLAHLRDIAKKLSGETKQPFANVHDAMYATMKKAQQDLGSQYPVCGGDGFHPGPNGQLIMAYAFLKGLGCDGNLGLITYDAKADKATGSDGHKVSKSGDKIEIESTRWPFCFEGDSKSANGTRSITAFLPFNDELNNLTLKVTGLGTPKGVVTWGDQTKEFPSEKLAAGINLAAEFDKTPFDAKFAELASAVAQKQNFETTMIKQIITGFRNYPAEVKADPAVQAALATLSDRLHARQKELDAAVRKTITPVKHTLTVGPLP